MLKLIRWWSFGLRLNQAVNLALYTFFLKQLFKCCHFPLIWREPMCLVSEETVLSFTAEFTEMVSLLFKAMSCAHAGFCQWNKWWLMSRTLLALCISHLLFITQRSSSSAQLWFMLPRSVLSQREINPSPCSFLPAGKCRIFSQNEVKLEHPVGIILSSCVNVFYSLQTIKQHNKHDLNSQYKHFSFGSTLSLVTENPRLQRPGRR